MGCGVARVSQRGPKPSKLKYWPYNLSPGISRSGAPQTLRHGAGVPDLGNLDHDTLGHRELEPPGNLGHRELEPPGNLGHWELGPLGTWATVIEINTRYSCNLAAARRRRGQFFSPIGSGPGGSGL